nr:ras guanine nucleotide exchange factor P-like [Ipomoea batatas]
MNGNGLKLDLKLNLSPPRVSHPMVVSPPIRSSTASPSSSCVSSENQEDGRRFCSSPEAASMVLVGCPRCLMYVMLAEGEPKCPKCKSTVLLNFFYDHQSNNARRA